MPGCPVDHEWRRADQRIFELWSKLLWRPYGAGHYPFTLTDLGAMRVDELEGWASALDEMRKREYEANKPKK